jgi:hypothetical protein
MNYADYEKDAAFESYTHGAPTIPAPPKPGEIMICQFCQQPIMPEQLKAEKNINQRKRCFKWHIHPGCYMGMSDQLDRAVPGLLAERKKAQERAQR